MAFDFTNFQDSQLDSEYITYLIDEVSSDNEIRGGRLWDYFRNPIVPASGVSVNALNANSRPYFQAQEAGLPARITGIERHSNGGQQLTDLSRKEVVVENDIAWRIHTMIDFLFGKPLGFKSLAGDPELAKIIEQTISAMLEANGGVSLLQEIALLGSIYGFVDIALRIPAGISTEISSSLLPSAHLSALGSSESQPDTSPSNPANTEGAQENGGQGPRGDRPRTITERCIAIARMLQLEAVEAPRVLPILEENDYRRVRYWIQKFHKHTPRLTRSKRPWFTFGLGGQQEASPAMVDVVEIVGPSWWQRYEDRQLITEGPNVLGRLPIIHIQNIAVPGSYDGISDVEPLVPLQDELNTRLSDRANRVTFQSFKMYLGKGIDDFLERPVGPGQMWATQNLDASIEEFGSDNGSPSEDIHIEHIRQAMDKVSGVTPLAAGLIRGNVGNLTSATALKVVLSGLLAKTAKKRLTYGVGLQQTVELALEWLDRVGLLKTSPEDRKIELRWANPMPVDEGEQLRNALMKAKLGVPSDQILAELGSQRKSVTTLEDQK